LSSNRKELAGNWPEQMLPQDEASDLTGYSHAKGLATIAGRVKLVL
jgi:hypothetical protein